MWLSWKFITYNNTAANLQYFPKSNVYRKRKNYSIKCGFHVVFIKFYSLKKILVSKYIYFTGKNYNKKKTEDWQQCVTRDKKKNWANCQKNCVIELTLPLYTIFLQQLQGLRQFSDGQNHFYLEADIHVDRISKFSWDLNQIFPVIISFDYKVIWE